MIKEAETAARLLAKFGETVTVATPGTSAYDPITGAPVTPVAGVSYTGKGYPSNYQATEINGTTIEAGDIRLVLQVLTVRPEVNWSAVVDSVTYRIMDVRPVRKAGEDAIYICQLRAN